MTIFKTIWFIIITIIFGYILFGLLLSILTYKACKKAAIEENIPLSILEFFCKTTLHWPLLIKYYIWPGNCWIEFKDTNGKVFHLKENDHRVEKIEDENGNIEYKFKDKK